jgi:hypothetical protein
MVESQIRGPEYKHWCTGEGHKKNNKKSVSEIQSRACLFSNTFLLRRTEIDSATVGDVHCCTPNGMNKYEICKGCVVLTVEASTIDIL